MIPQLGRTFFSATSIKTIRPELYQSHCHSISERHQTCAHRVSTYISSSQVLRIARERQANDLASRVIEDGLLATLNRSEVDLLVLSFQVCNTQQSYPQAQLTIVSTHRSSESQMFPVQRNGRSAFLRRDRVDFLAILKDGHPGNIGYCDSSFRSSDGFGPIDRLSFRGRGANPEPDSYQPCR
jgi:hypothetical protein